MKLADLSIKRPVFISMMVLSLVLFGIIGWKSIGVALYPKVDFPIVSISTTLRGASPEIIDVDVTDKIEEAMSSINGVKSISSTSTEGLSSVIIEFELSRDIDFAVQDVREKISTAKMTLPKDVDEPLIMKIDTDASPVMWIALSGPQSERELSAYADEIFKEKLQQIDGVGSIHMAGLRLRQMRVWLDRNKLDTYKITPQEVANAIKRKNIELPGGRIESDTKEYSIKIMGELGSAKAFENLIIKYSNGSAIKLSDIATVEDGLSEERSVSKFNRKKAIGLGIQKQSGVNTVEVIDNIKKEMKKAEKNLPHGMKLEIAFDQSKFIKHSINEVKTHLILGGLFTVFIVFLFLKSIRLTWISAISIPVSIISTVAMMKFFNFTFNNMTMLALSLAIGIVIDDAIVVIENIHRHVKQGMHPFKAASFATEEIGGAVTATTIAILAIFIPVAFMDGIIGRFFMQFAFTVVFAVTISLIVSFTLTPMLASKIMTPYGQEKEPAFYIFLENIYQYFEKKYKKLLEFCLKYRKTVMISAFAIFILSMYITKFIGKEFMPSEDQGNFIVRMEAPIDYTVNKINKLFSKAEDIVLDMPEVSSAFYGQGFEEVNKGVLFVNMPPRSERNKGQQEVQKEIRLKLKNIVGLKTSVEDISLVGGGSSRVPIQFTVKGDNLDELKTYVNKIVEEYSKLPGIVDIDTTAKTGKPELRVLIDRNKAADLGVDISTIVESINFLMSGEVDISKFKDKAKGRRYDVRMRLLKKDRSTPQDIEKIHIRTQKNQFIKLSEIISIREAGGPSEINRLDRQRSVSLYANLEKKPLGEAKSELDALALKILPEKFSFQYRGMADTMGESFKFLMYALALGIILAYMVLAAQFENFIHPFIILLSMPLAFIGAFGLLLITGKTLNIFSFIGLILLMGLVKKNAILLIDYMNILIRNGLSRREAVLTACPVRLRPILMTTFAMIFGMLPIAIGFGDGSESRAPMAIAVIGGLISSLFLTLLVIPVVYEVLEELIEKFFKKKTPLNSEKELIEDKTLQI